MQPDDLTLEPYWQTRNKELDAVHGLRHRLVEPPLRVAKRSSERRLRHQPKSDLVRHKNYIARCAAETRAQQRCLLLKVPPRLEQIRQPQRETIDQNNATGPALAIKNADDIDRLLHGTPACRTIFLMPPDAISHLPIPRFGRRKIDARIARRFGKQLRTAALA